MNWYDEFRVMNQIRYNRIREKFAKFLVKIVQKISPQVFNRCVIDKKIVFDISRYIPFDNKWHHYAFTVDFWGKHDKKRIRKKEKLTCYLDGRKISKRKKR